MNKLKYVVTILAALTISSVVTANEVKMAKANWDTGYFQAEVYKQALEKRLVFNSSATPQSLQTARTAL